MDIQTGKIVYHFPTLKLLESFISSHAKDIMYQEEMVDLYKKYDGTGFNFYETKGGFDWSFDYITNYQRVGYLVIKYCQRTE